MIEDQEEMQETNGFHNQFPAIELPTKNYSLEADMITGWRPKLKAVGPIPFNFDSQIVDEVVEELTSLGKNHKERVIYLGNRFSSSFKMHKEMTHQYTFKHQAAVSGSFNHMAAYFKKFHSNFKSKNSRLFKGMNPTIKTGDQVVFCSDFESGNLDAAIKVGQNQFDVFMRVDTNTRGHVQWFNFTVRNFGKKKIRINIVNFKKYKTLYSRDMRPYIYSENIRQTKGFKWHQGGENVKYDKKKLRYEFLEENFFEETISFNCLTFDYTFQTQWETVQFAYCAPFTYSQALKMIRELKQTMKANTGREQRNDKIMIDFIKEENLCQSLGGLDIPMLTITDPEADDRNKRCILASARIHPGETCGSHMMKGFLEFICSDCEQAQNLRKVVVFKVIPMLNPDGVVIGNFRTNFSGRDLNRQFRTSADFLIPEVKALKQLVLQLKNQFKSRLIFFFDFHGHSVKKNVFLYGPAYEIWETNYYKTRIFPKIMASKTQIFRYYSCMFRIADFKRTTARAVLLNTIPHCYTIEASTGFYYSPQQKKDIPFTPQSWAFMGKTIAESIKDYMDLMYNQDMSKQQKKQKLNELKSNKVKNNKQKFEKNLNRNGNFQTRLISVSSSQKNKQYEEKNQTKNEFSDKVRSIIESIKKQQALRENQEDQAHQSDKYSEGGSDSQNQSDDIPEEELLELHQSILDSMKQFRKNFHDKQGRQERQYSMKETKKTPVIKEQRISMKLKPNRQSKGIEMVASLRKKAQQMQKIKQVFYWPKIREESKSRHSQMQQQSGNRDRTKINFKQYLEHIDKDNKLTNKKSNLQLEVQGHAEF